MDSVLRDIEREKSKMQADTENLFRHYEKLAGFVRQHLEASTIEWAKLVTSHPGALLLVVETTRVVDENGSTYGESEPIRFTIKHLASGEMWDQLLHPTHSCEVRGAEYHGLAMADLRDKPRISQAWPEIVEALAGHHVIIFGADYVRQALRSVYQTHLLDDAFCLQNKCKEYYGEFYDLSLEKILGYQSIDKKREELRDSRDRLSMLMMVVRNLAAGMAKKVQEPEPSDEIDEHPF